MASELYITSCAVISPNAPTLLAKTRKWTPLSKPAPEVHPRHQAGSHRHVRVRIVPAIQASSSHASPARPRGNSTAHPGGRKLRKESRKQVGVILPTTVKRDPDAIPRPEDVPKSIHDIDSGARNILGFSSELSPEHPGFMDEEYKRRRGDILRAAATHRIGEPIPTVAYTEQETALWGQVLAQLSALYPTHACREFNAAFGAFGFRPDRIPQLQELNEVLASATGWAIRPVAGLLRPRDFLNGLAFRTFHSTQYIRHASHPMYTPEPDVIHEVLGHMPMLVNQQFADMAQAIGRASLGCSDREMWHLTKVYWYTLEFGVLREPYHVPPQGQAAAAGATGNGRSRAQSLSSSFDGTADLMVPKAFGAGLLSSIGELDYLLNGAIVDKGEGRREHRWPTFEFLDPLAPLPKISYKDGYQPVYFVCEGFEEVRERLLDYSRRLEEAHVQGRTLPVPGIPAPSSQGAPAA
eukprot:jgi/Mesvir1/17886/Mv12959-RA.1